VSVCTTYPLNMAMLKKRKVDSECRNVQERWTENYFFIEYKRKPVCLICLDTVSASKNVI
jgi:hypothetical protein